MMFFVGKIIVNASVGIFLNGIILRLKKNNILISEITYKYSGLIVTALKEHVDNDLGESCSVIEYHLKECAGKLNVVMTDNKIPEQEVQEIMDIINAIPKKHLGTGSECHKLE